MVVPSPFTPLTELAPAKVNLTLRVLGRRADGYHDIESLVAFADVGDELEFAPADALDLTVRGPNAASAGPIADNLILKAARALASHIEGLELGRFALIKHLPVAAGLGGGSADAAAALRLLARANGFAPDDPRLMAAARATGADVPVCLDPRPRLMRGVGDILSAPLDLPRLSAVLLNPGVALATKDVFAALGAAARRHPEVRAERASKGDGIDVGFTRHRHVKLPKSAIADLGGRPSFEGLATLGHLRMTELIAVLAENQNDLEAPAISLQPVIADVLAALRSMHGIQLPRMSGSGATCFGLFDSKRAAAAAARSLKAAHPDWWVRATVLG
jgi:4-diphosphocytidyl-2-C-methyl-D-erythritol kinase